MRWCPPVAGPDSGHVAGVPRTSGCQVHRRQSPHRCGLNTHIKITGTAEKRRWRLKYPKAEEPVNSPFYSQLPGVGIAELLWFVAAHTGYLGTFSHVLDRYVKDAPDPRELLACIVAMGTNMGLGKMAEVSGRIPSDADDGAELPAPGNPACRQRCHHERDGGPPGVPPVRYPGHAPFQ